jgi:hypothetical protein
MYGNLATITVTGLEIENNITVPQQEKIEISSAGPHA